MRTPIFKQHQYAQIAIIAAILTIGLKSIAYIITGSVGMLSDAMESLVNLATAFLTLWLIKVSTSPEDDDHHFGHTKAEYFSSMAEGLFIMLAAGGILFSSIERLMHPTGLSDIGIGLALSTVASAINGLVAYLMFQGSKFYKSPALAGEGHHLMTDVYTSGGVLAGLFLVSITEYNVLDPIIGICVALQILYTAYKLIKDSISGLMDTALDKESLNIINEHLGKLCSSYSDLNIIFDLKSRCSGSIVFLYITIYLPSELSLLESSKISDLIEYNLSIDYPKYKIFLNVKPNKRE